jgi:Photoprotection regulator fluorescence recovery protein
VVDFVVVQDMDVQQVTVGVEGIEHGWSLQEQAIARQAFDLAYDREIAGLMQAVTEQAGAITQAQDMWTLHDFLSAKRHEVDGKYDFRYPFLLVVFARLVKEGWLQPQDLEGLDASKRAKISALSRM